MEMAILLSDARALMHRCRTIGNESDAALVRKLHDAICNLLQESAYADKDRLSSQPDPADESTRMSADGK